MANSFLVLLDQNVPQSIVAWLKQKRPNWQVVHVASTALSGKPDRDIFEWAQRNHAIIVTYDEDFADQRSFPVHQHHGIIRLRVWPTTIEETQRALARLLEEFSDDEITGALVIIDRHRIRLRRSTH